MIKTYLPHKFTPRPYQQQLFHDFFVLKKKRIIRVLHRRAGKDKEALQLILAAALQRVGKYFYTMPQLKQIRRALWNGIDRDGFKYMDHIPRRLMARPPKNDDMTIYLINGSIIQFAGTDHYDDLMGDNPAGIVFSEYSLQTPMAWEYLRPILAENEGWALFNYTPRARNHGWNLYSKNKNNPKWSTTLLTVEQTERAPGVPVISQEAIQEERDAGMPEEMIQQEFYCSFEVSLPGAYYTKELMLTQEEKRIYDFDINPNTPVFTFWDIGVGNQGSDNTAIWFMQPHGKELRMIHYYQNQGYGLTHYAEYLQIIATRYNIIYGKHFAPFDADQRDWWVPGMTRLKEAEKVGIFFEIVPRKRIADGINAARYIFKRVHFHQTNCEMGILALQSYHRVWDNDLKCFADYPKKDWSRDGADAFRYFAVAWDDLFGKDQNKEMLFYKTFNI